MVAMSTKISYILAYKDNATNDATENPKPDVEEAETNEKLMEDVEKREIVESAAEKRATFEKNLIQSGLILETGQIGDVFFTKIFLPEAVLHRYAEILKLQMPIKLEANDMGTGRIVTYMKYFRKVYRDMMRLEDEEHTMMDTFSRNKLFLFNKEHLDYFQEVDRIFVIAYILDREHYLWDETKKGIKNLIADGVYISAYPLHDDTSRNELLNGWATNRKLKDVQPITKIRRYFGTNIALYYAWLGFYTRMLIFPAVLSLVYMVYGLITLPGDGLSNQICTSDYVMCPLCDKYCPFWNLKDTCVHAKLSHLIDNDLTPYYCVVISVWSAVYFQLWKRYNARLVHTWGLQNFNIDDEPDRPQFTSRIVNKITKLGASKKGIRYSMIIFSYSAVIFWVLLVFAVTLGILVYKISLSTSKELWAGTSYNQYFIAFTCSVIDVVCIYILERTYGVVMIKLTEIEMHRTQTEYDNSLALKLYIFQFANRFSSTFYIAFLKGKLVGNPAKYNRIFGYRQEECEPGGCLTELSIQLVTLIFGLHVMPVITGHLATCWNWTVRKVVSIAKSDETDRNSNDLDPIWRDFNLRSTDSTLLFYDYLEIMTQFGYLTIFIAAFPIAPLIAVLNNLFELRSDAKNMLLRHQRPVPQRAKNIGIWSHMIETTYHLGVYSTAFILAFSTNFIPKLVHSYRMSILNSNRDYLDHTLALFNTTDFQEQTIPLDNPMNITSCRYREYRNPPGHEYQYTRPIKYYQVLAAKLAFMIIYQNVVTLLQKFIQWVLPDMPRTVGAMIRKEHKLITDAIIDKEKIK